MSLISLSNVTKIFANEGVTTEVLKGITFSIDKGEFVAIIGPSGSGKSTLLHILGFLDDTTDGQYRFNGKLQSEYSPDEQAAVRNEQMGFVFQAFNLLPKTTVYNNVKLPLMYSKIKESEWDDLTKKAIESVGLSHRSNHFSSQLSGGEKQRVAIARALVTNPAVIFADEPTGNLDSKSGQQVMEILQRLNEKEGHTIVLITHETYTAEMAGRIIALKDGEIVSDKEVRQRREAAVEFKK
ncbi:MAG: ABC transporter ATP-binding protein [Candidatus Komeilibacteria bacterium]